MKTRHNTTGRKPSRPLPLRWKRAAAFGLAAFALAAIAGAQGWNVDLVGSCDTPGVAWDVYVVGDYAYVGDCESGLHVIDVANPTSPTLVGTCDTPSCARAVCVDGWFAYVADWHSGLQVIDVSIPFLPYILSACDAPGDEEDVFVAGNFAYVAGGVHGLHVVDLRSLFLPQVVGTCALPGDADGIFIRGNLAYVACGAYLYDEGGLHIIDVTSPSQPTLLSSYLMPSYARDVQVVGSRAFVAAGFDGLQILDVSDPSLPTAVGAYDTLSSAQGLCVDGDLVYLTAFSEGLKVLDVSSPSSPTIRGVYATPSPAVAVVVSGGLAYVACRQSGLLVLRFTDPQIPRELYVDDDAPNDPGPGNPAVSDPLEDGTPAHPFDAFQEAIDHARDGDTVTVLDGTYNGPGNLWIDYQGKAITIRSQNGPADCIVDGQGNGTVFQIHRREDERSVLRGFTICSGAAQYGGGGVAIDLSGLTVIDCVFVGNTAHRGGAIYSHYSHATLVNCAFVENAVDDDGGAVSSIASGLSVVNCRFNGNTALMGGGIWCVETDLPLVNCTFHGNVAGFGGGAICSNVECGIWLRNCILWGDTAPEGPEIAVYNDHWETHVMIVHSDLEGSTAAIRSNAHTPFPATWGPGSIDADPAFVTPGHWDDAGTTDPADDMWIDGDYGLGAGSPCIDAGDTAALPPDAADLDGDGDTSEPLPLDLDGNPRVLGAAVDLGAYETSAAGQIEATIWILPRTLNLKSKGRWITCWIELSPGYNVRDIDVGSLLLNGVVAAAPHPRAVGDHDEDGIRDLMVKFPRDEVIAILEVGEQVTVNVTGVMAGEPFQGFDVIRVIEPGVGPKSVVAGQTLEFDVAPIAEGLTGRIVFSAENLPPGAALDPRTGRFRWTPTPAQVGIYSIILHATDDTDEIVDTTTVTVEAAPGTPPQAAMGSGLEVVGQIGGECLAIDVEGSLAYVGQGWYLKVFDVSDPSSPVIVGSIRMPGSVRDVLTTGGLAYVTQYGRGLDIVDVSNLSAPAFLGSWSDCESCNCVGGGFAYTIRYWDAGGEWFSALQILDVSDPTSPVLCSTYGKWVYGVHVSGNRAYLATGDPGLRVLDVSDPLSPTLLGACAIPQNPPPNAARAVSVFGNRACVCANRGLYVIDVSDPTSPTLLGGYKGSAGSANDVRVVGNRAYSVTSYYKADVQVFDVSGPASPTLLGSWDAPSWVSDLAPAGDVVYATVRSRGSGLYVLDVAGPSTPTLLSAYRVPGNVSDVSVAGDLAYVTGYMGVYVIDVADPAWPTPMGMYPSGSDHISVAGDRAYLDGPVILGIADPTSPVLLGGYDVVDYPQDHFVIGSCAYVTLSYDECHGYPDPGCLQVFDATDPTSPVLLGFHDVPYDPDDVFVVDNLAYVGGEGFMIVDVSDPTSMTLRGAYPFRGHVWVRNGLAYVIGNGLSVLDVSDPTSPMLRGHCPSISGDIYVSGDAAYCLEHSLCVVDISDPALPVLRASMDIPGNPGGVYAADDLIFVAGGASGLWILRLSPAPTLARSLWRLYR